MRKINLPAPPFFFWSLLNGVFFSLCFPNLIFEGSFLFLIPSQIAFWWLWFQMESSKKKFLHILAFNLGLFPLGLYYLIYTIREFHHFSLFPAVLVAIAFTPFLHLHLYAFLFFDSVFGRRFRFQGAHAVWAYSGVLACLEFFTPFMLATFVGGPWLVLAPYLGLADKGGMIVYSFITYVISLFFVDALITRKPRYIILVPIGLLLAFNFTLGGKKPEKGTPNFNVRLVQANIGSIWKVAAETGDGSARRDVRERYSLLSVEPSKIGKLDLIVWPETSYPRPFVSEEVAVDPFLQSILSRTSAEFVLGGYEAKKSAGVEAWEGRTYNAAIHLSTEGKVQGIYRKNILLPFSEALPFGIFNELIAKAFSTRSIFSEGEGTPYFRLGKNWKFITPICYEILYPSLLRSFLNQHEGASHFILNLSNDSWFGNTAENKQHQLFAHWRALEFGLPVIRSTNTGITSVLYSDGSQSAVLHWGEENYLDVSLSLDKEHQPTLFQEWGFGFTFSVWLMGMSFLFGMSRFWNKKGG